MHMGAFLFRKGWAIGLILFIHCKLANLSLVTGFFKQIKFGSFFFIVVMLLLLSLIEALPGATCSLVLLKY